MATGIVRGEKSGDDAISRELLTDATLPLPDHSSEVSLRLENRLPDEEVLAPSSHALVRYSKRQFRVAREVKPDALLLSDNYWGMKSLLRQFRGAVGLIYLDPPFQTGMEFESRQRKHAYKDVLARAPYLEFMRRRFVLMRELLADTGTIYVHIGHQMVFHLKVVMDEVFGASHFINLVVRRKCSSKNYTRNQYPNLHDYILFYSKTRNYKFHQPRIEPSQEWIEREYPKIDKRTGRRFKLVPIHAPGVRYGESGQPWRGINPPPGKHWQLKPSKLEQLDANGDIHWSKNGNPRRKVWLLSDKTVPRTDYWSEFRDAHHQSVKGTGYPTEKNFRMMREIVASGTDPGDLVLDPFCGSGTTLHAASELGRRWIGIDDSFAAFEALFSRFNEGVKALGDFVNGGLHDPEDPQPRAKGHRASYSVYCDERYQREAESELRELLSRDG